VKTYFSNLVSNISKFLRNNIYRKDVGVFLIFLFLSSVFWLLNQLEDNYVTTVNYPVKYINPPPDKVFVGELPSRLELEVEGTGFRLMEYKIGKELMPVELNINSYSLEPSEDRNSLKYFIATNSIKSQISQQFSSAVKILDISPDSLFFEFAEEAKRKVPIEPNFSYELAPQLMLQGGIELSPDSVIISGPDKILDTINFVKTKYEELGEIKRDYSFVASLKRTHPRLNYSTRNINVTLPVESFTEGKLEKEILVTNEPDSLEVRTFPKNVDITYLVGLSNYDKVIPELFKVSVSYSQVKQGKERLDVTVEKAPEYLKSYTYSPQSVDYIIEKKND
jgi:YbbR domain-containing protein